MITHKNRSLGSSINIVCTENYISVETCTVYIDVLYVHACLCVCACNVYMFAQSSNVQIEQMEIAWPTHVQQSAQCRKQYISWLADITSNHRLIRDFQKLFVTPHLKLRAITAHDIEKPIQIVKIDYFILILTYSW